MFRHVPSTDSIVPMDSGFARRADRRGKLRYWIAGLPLIAAAAITFNAPAPAETSSDITPAPVEAQQQARWSAGNIRQLVAAIEAAEAEGLNPADYQLAALRAALANDDHGASMDSLADGAALSLARDYADGRIQDKAAFDWHIEPRTDAGALPAQLAEALDRGTLSGWLHGLLPDNDQYRALKAAYAAASPGDATRDVLRANLERWRWMPRTLGDRYIFVNVPSYRLELMGNGVEEASYNVVVGAPKTPTPQLALQAQSVIANPAWILPPSVLREAGWRNKGYSVTRRADGSLMVRQAPGPRNALGRIKIDMPNPMAIYLHDTPNKAAFNKTDRALSHGCIRVQNIEELAALLHGQDLDEALADPTRTRVLQLEKSVPVYIVYFTARADADGTIRYLNDPYRHDQALVDRIGNSGDHNTLRMAAR